MQSCLLGPEQVGDNIVHRQAADAEVLAMQPLQCQRSESISQVTLHQHLLWVTYALMPYSMSTSQNFLVAHWVNLTGSARACSTSSRRYSLKGWSLLKTRGGSNSPKSVVPAPTSTTMKASRRFWLSAMAPAATATGSGTPSPIR